MEKEKKYYKLSDLFSSFERGKVHSQSSLPDGNSHFYVGAKKKDNGVMCRCGYDEEIISKGNCIIFICNGEGSVGYSLYMDRDFMASGDLVLAYGDFLNPLIGLYLVTLLDLERPKYSFGRKYGSHVKDSRILLPSKNNTPDWTYIEDYVKDTIIPQLPKKAQKVWLKKYDTKPIMSTNLLLKTPEWKWFSVEELFSLETTKGTTTDELTEGVDVPYIAAKHDNNGFEMMCSRDDNAQFISKGNCIVFICLGAGSAGYALYQGADFIGMSGKTVCGYNSNMNQYSGIFLASILSKERPKYSFGRSWTGERLKKTKIKLPVTPGGTPDWQFMEDYIKSLPYSKNLEPSDPNEVVDELMEVKKEMIKLRHELKAHHEAQEVQVIGGNVTYIDNSTNYTIKK